MTQITAEEWLAVWERVREGRHSAIEFSPREQLRLFKMQVARIESFAADVAEKLYSKAVWIGADRPRNEVVALVQQAIIQLDISPGDLRPICQAAIGGDLTFLRAVHDLNEAKERFRLFCLASDARMLQLKRNSRKLVKCVYPLQAELCRRPNFDYLLAYQQLPVLSGLPSLMTFKEEVARRTNRIARDVLLARLSRKSGDAAVRDIERVRKTPSTEIEFAIDGPTRPAKHVYVRFDGMDASGALRRTIRTNLPVVFRLGRKLPAITFPDDPGVRTFKVRNRPTVTICKEWFLETMPVHRYFAATQVTQ